MGYLKVLLCMMACMVVLNTYGQEITVEPRRNTVFLELGGNAFHYSLNIDRILKYNERWKLAGRLGVKVYRSIGIHQHRFLGAPLELSYLRGGDNNFLELGFGLTANFNRLSYYYHEDYYQSSLISVFRIGYRHQKKKGGLFFKAALTPYIGVGSWLDSKKKFFIGMGNYLPMPWVGVGVGWTFK